MAKEDFCFNYYDGDAARDKAHMNRLERGAYDDIISAQRKRGHLSLEDIKKVLSSDFDTCWPALEWVLLQDPDGKYYIEWVDKSIEKMRRHSEKQKKNVLKRWGKDTNSVPDEYHGINLEVPLENGNGNGIIKEREVQEGKPFGLQMQEVFTEKNKSYPQRPGQDIPAIIEFANFISSQKNFKSRFPAFSSDEKNIILHEWGRVSDWYYERGNNKSLEFLSRFKMQEILLEINNNQKLKNDTGNTKTAQRPFAGGKKEDSAYAGGL